MSRTKFKSKQPFLFQPQGLVCPPPLTVTNNQPSSSGAQAQTPSTDPEAADFEVVSFNPVAGVTIGDSSPYFYPSVAPTAPPAPANYGPQAEPKATSNGYQQTCKLSVKVKFVFLVKEKSVGPAKFSGLHQCII